MTGPFSLERRAARIRRRARRPDGYEELARSVSRCHTVLIGEATHGTDEFYRDRAAITRRLVEEHGFGLVAIEGDWPATERVDSFVRGRGRTRSAIDSLAGFRRFPSWMWRNAAMLDFVGWLQDHNESLPPSERCSIHGLDLYSMHASADRVLRYLEAVAPDEVERARERYECLDGTSRDPQRYAQEVLLGLRPSCQREVLAQLVELTRQRARLVAHAAESIVDADDAWFDAQQNAAVVRNAERYYRSMFLGSTESWNLRDRHMAETLMRLQQQQRARRCVSGKAVVWAHNSHVGDARATEMGGRRGQLTLGQLVRQEQAEACALIGFTTFHGTVTAAHAWDEPAQHRHVLPALDDSCEHLFHHVGIDRFVLLSGDLRTDGALRRPLLQRAIGVIYRPETERDSHYFMTTLADQFDAVIHIDATRAVEPLETFAPGAVDELAETWPFGT